MAIWLFMLLLLAAGNLVLWSYCNGYEHRCEWLKKTLELHTYQMNSLVWQASASAGQKGLVRLSLSPALTDCRESAAQIGCEWNRLQWLMDQRSAFEMESWQAVEMF